MDEEIIIAMENADAMRALCAVNDGDCALMYAFAFTHGGRCRVSDFVLASGFDDKRAERAKSLLIVYKICRLAGLRPDVRQEEYTPAELLAAQRGDPAFRGICDYWEQIQGRITKSEIEILYGIYGRLNMPPDVIMLMINYCRARGHLSARTLEKTAYEWHDKGITTYSLASDMADRMDEKRRAYAHVLSLFGISGRAPSESERKYISSWLDMGVSDELIKMAYDRTVLRTGKLQWRYMHKILADWHEKGYLDRRQVERAEGTAPSSGNNTHAQSKSESVIEAVTRRFDERRQAREKLQEERLAELRRRSPDFAQNEIALRQVTVKKARFSMTGDSQELASLTARHDALTAQRRDILASLGLDESYISIPPDCPKCGDRGYIGAEMCDCFKRACAEEEQRRKQSEIL